MRKLIVGVDPGVTCGLAVLTLDGRCVYVGSKRNWLFSDIIHTIGELGEAVLIASDVSPPPASVSKISSSLNAVTYTPPTSLNPSYKQQLAKSFAEEQGVDLENSHEVDALAAALKAYQHYKNKFNQIETRLKEADSRIYPEEVKALVIRGYTIQRAIDTLQPKSKIEVKIKAEKKETEKARGSDSEIEELRAKLKRERNRVRELREANILFKRRLNSMRREILELRKKFEETFRREKVKLRKEREYQILLDEINILKDREAAYLQKIRDYEKRLERLRYLKELESKGELVFLKPIEAFTREGLEKAFRLYDIKLGDVVLLLDASGGGPSTAELLVKKGVRAVIIQTKMAHPALEIFVSNDIPVISSENVNVQWVEGFPYAKVEDIEKAQRTLLEEERKYTEERMEEILEEYRSARQVERD